MKLPKHWARNVATYDKLTPLIYGRKLARKRARKMAAHILRVKKIACGRGFVLCASCGAAIRNRHDENFCRGCEKYICAMCAESQDHWKAGVHGLLANIITKEKQP